MKENIKNFFAPQQPAGEVPDGSSTGARVGGGGAGIGQKPKQKPSPSSALKRKLSESARFPEERQLLTKLKQSQPEEDAAAEKPTLSFQDEDDLISVSIMDTTSEEKEEDEHDEDDAVAFEVEGISHIKTINPFIYNQKGQATHDTHNIVDAANDFSDVDADIDEESANLDGGDDQEQYDVDPIISSSQSDVKITMEVKNGSSSSASTSSTKIATAKATFPLNILRPPPATVSGKGKSSAAGSKGKSTGKGKTKSKASDKSQTKLFLPPSNSTSTSSNQATLTPAISRPGRSAKLNAPPLNFYTGNGVGLFDDLEDGVKTIVSSSSVISGYTLSKTNVVISDTAVLAAMTGEGGGSNLPFPKKTKNQMFFMTRKEREEQLQIQRILELQSRLKETSKFSNNVTNAAGKVINPFFAARKSANTTTNYYTYEGDDDDMMILSSKALTPAVTETPFPTNENCHVGFIYPNSPPLELQQLLYPWPAKKNDSFMSVATEQDIPTSKVIPGNWKLSSDTSTNFNLKAQKIDRNTLLMNLESQYASQDILNAHIFEKLMKDEDVKSLPVETLQMWNEVSTADCQQSSIYSQSTRKICSKLVDWLETWSEKFGKRITSSTRKKKKPRKGASTFISTSSDEDDVSYRCDSDGDVISDEEFTSSPQNAPFSKPVLLIQGPSGSGKSMLIKIASHLASCHVLELSTSDKRNAKVLNEVTKSACTLHTIKAKKTQGFFAAASSAPTIDLEEKSGAKSVVVLEDVDELLEEDKGFWGGLGQILKTAKCPIILTCTDSPLKELNEQISSCGVNLLGNLNQNISTIQLEDMYHEDIVMNVALECARRGYFLDQDFLSNFVVGDENIGPALMKAQIVCTGMRSAIPASKEKWLYLKQDFSIDNSAVIDLDEEESAPAVATLKKGPTLQELEQYLNFQSTFPFPDVALHDPETSLTEAAPTCPLIQPDMEELNQTNLDNIGNFYFLCLPEFSHVKDAFTADSVKESLSHRERVTIFTSNISSLSRYNIGDEGNQSSVQTSILRPSTFNKEVLPYLSLICKYDNLKQSADQAITEGSIGQARRTGSRSSGGRRKVGGSKRRRHLVLEDDVEYEILGGKWFDGLKEEVKKDVMIAEDE